VRLAPPRSPPRPQLTDHSEHAQRAVTLYENLYAHRTLLNPPTAIQRHSQQDLLKEAKKVLAQAEQDAEQYPGLDLDEVEAAIDEALEAEERLAEGAQQRAEDEMEAEYAAEQEAQSQDTGVSEGPGMGHGEAEAAEQHGMQMGVQGAAEADTMEDILSDPIVATSASEFVDDDGVDQSFPRLPTPPRTSDY